MKFYLLIFCAISIFIFSNCGSDTKNTTIKFNGVIDDFFNDTSIYSNFAPSYSSTNYSVFAFNIANLQDTYTATVSNKNFSIVLPASGNYIFFAISPTYSFKMIKPNISLSNNSDTINFKSTVIAQYIEQIYAFDTSLTAINSSLPNLINEANNVYENAISNLKSDTAAELDKSKAILIKTISAVLYDKINNNSNLLNEFVNDIKIDSLSLSIYADSFIKNYFQFNASDTLIINGHTYNAADTTSVLSTTKISSIINLLQTLLKSITKKIYITTSVYGQVGAVAVVNLDNISNVVFNAALTSNDNDIKYYDNKLFILNRSEDNIQIIDATNYKTIKQYNIGGAYSNPHDIVFTSSSIAYVCFNSKNFISKINPLTGVLYDTFSLLPFVASNDSDNNPEATRMQKINNKLFILMQSLDTNNWWTPTGYSRIAVFDLTNDTWIDVDTATAGIQAIEL
ncbi:MAG TPA: hypothetical protein PLD27_07735, partial [bacterium]|nr:hypothetical protein [bacterium]